MQHLQKPTLMDLICATVMATLVTCSPGAVARDAFAPPTDLGLAMRLKPVWVETHLKIRWRGEQPVVGAKVFDHGTGKLLGVTDYRVQGTEETAAPMSATTSSAYINAAALWWESY